MTTRNAAADGQLLAIIERIERLTTEKKTISEDINDVYAEAKSSGYDVKALKAIVKERAQPATDRAEHEAILNTYRIALGMLVDLPLGQAAMERAATERPAQRRQRGGETRMAG